MSDKRNYFIADNDLVLYGEKMIQNLEDAGCDAKTISRRFVAYIETVRFRTR